MDSFFSIQKLSATGAFCPERKAFFISIYARTLNLPRVSSAPSLASRANHDEASEDAHGGDADGEAHGQTARPLFTR